MLLLEIGLIAWAWRRGWKARALLPLAIGLVVALVAGAMMEDPDAASGFGVFMDLLVMGILVWMGAKGRTQPTPTAYRVQKSAATQESAPEPSA